MTRFVQLFVLGVVVTSSVAQVEHAPTVAQCQADQRLWYSRLENAQTPLPDIKVIRTWVHEMNECDSVDPNNHVAYLTTEAEIMAEQKGRMEHFIARQGLWDKFIEDDAAGKR